MKKIIALALAAVVAISALTGCSSGGSSSGTASGGSAASSAATEAAKPANRLEEIKARGTLTVAMEPYFAPNEFIDPSKQGDEQYVGFDVEIGKYIAEKLGVKLQIVPLEFQAVIASIVDGKYDLAISALAYTPARAENVNLSKGYYFSTDSKGYGLLCRTEDAGKYATVEDLAGKTVIAQSGSIQEALMNDANVKYGEFKRVSSTPDAYLAVTEGKADVACCSINHAELYIEANKDCNLMVIEGFKFSLPEEYDGTRIAIKKGEDELTDFVNQCIDELRAKGQIDEWREYYKEYAAKLGID